jgi:hypothetical protein
MHLSVSSPYESILRATTTREKGNVKKPFRSNLIGQSRQDLNIFLRSLDIGDHKTTMRSQDSPHFPDCPGSALLAFDIVDDEIRNDNVKTFIGERQFLHVTVHDIQMPDPLRSCVFHQSLSSVSSKIPL